jgi:hypothetical protein
MRFADSPDPCHFLKSPMLRRLCYTVRSQNSGIGSHTNVLNPTPPGVNVARINAIDADIAYKQSRRDRFTLVP